MARLTFKKWFEHFKPDEETTTILVNGYTEIVEPTVSTTGFEPGSMHSLQSVLNYYLVGKAVDKLAEYEDLEEQGLLLRLPCKVGANAFRIVNDSRKHYIRLTKFKLEDIGIFGTLIFATKEEAEAALQKMQEGK